MESSSSSSPTGGLPKGVITRLSELRGCLSTIVKQNKKCRSQTDATQKWLLTTSMEVVKEKGK